IVFPQKNASISTPFREILVQQTPLFIWIYRCFVGFSGSTNYRERDTRPFVKREEHSESLSLEVREPFSRRGIIYRDGRLLNGLSTLKDREHLPVQDGLRKCALKCVLKI
ncbi:MAG: hypothetical protein ABSG51_18660, partial [Terracidiphilus sp.]